VAEGTSRTSRQRLGDAAEERVASLLRGRGWQVLGRNVHAGRGELDIVAVDPGPPARLVVVEVRWRGTRGYGGAEGSFDGRKRLHLRAGIARLLEAGRLPDGAPLPRHPIAVDLAVVEPSYGNGGSRVVLYKNALA